MQIFPSRIFFWLVLLVSFSSSGVYSAQDPTIAVLISSEISPYVAAVNGLETTLTHVQTQRFFLDKNSVPYSLSGESASLRTEQYSALVAIGPDALSYLLREKSASPVVFGMILNPQQLFKNNSHPVCGVSLNIPIDAQFKALKDRLPWLSRLGVLFDPRNNQSWFDTAAKTATRLGFELIPLEVETKPGRISIVGDITRVDAILFIPDSSIISRVVIQHIIKQALLRKVPVVGYNKFFLDSGATLSFIIDYEQIGRVVGDLVETQLTTGRPCGVIAPDFTTKVNPDTWNLLQLEQKKLRK